MFLHIFVVAWIDVTGAQAHSAHIHLPYYRPVGHQAIHSSPAMACQRIDSPLLLTQSGAGSKTKSLLDLMV